MTITFANTSNEYFDVNKTYTTVSTKTGASVVYPCDVLNPTFKIKGGYINANCVTGVFDRNYWITNQTLNDGINYVTCTVDAFSSWKNSIYGTTQNVNRSETKYNPYLTDDIYPIPNKVETKMLKSSTELIGTDWTTIMGVI